MKNVYIEITNVCNLACTFCPGHDRAPRFMPTEDFRAIAKKIDGKADNIFLHVMGEPLLHPDLDVILSILDGMEHEVAVKITTNGTLIGEKIDTLLCSRRLKTVCISLHSFEANADGCFDGYMATCLDAAARLAEADKFAVLRLWNEGGADSLNPHIFDSIGNRFPENEWEKTRRGIRAARHVFVELGEKFDWPDGDKLSGGNGLSDGKGVSDSNGMPDTVGDLETDCHALLTQYAILADGTVVPCCLDRNGDIPLGNIFLQTPEEILASPRAKAMRDCIAAHRATERLCATCGKRCGAFQK